MAVKKDSSNRVSKLYDICPNNNDVSGPASDINKPVWIASQVNGKSALQFLNSGNASYLSGAWGFTGSAFSVMIVEKQNGYVNYANLITDASNTNHSLSLGYDASSPTKLAISSSNISTSASNLSQNTTGFHIIDYQSNGISGGNVSVNVTMDGTAASSALTLSSLVSGTTLTTIGDFGTSYQYYLNGEIAFFLIISSNVASGPWGNMRTWMDSQYAVY